MSIEALNVLHATLIASLLCTTSLIVGNIFSFGFTSLYFYEWNAHRTKQIISQSLHMLMLDKVGGHLNFSSNHKSFLNETFKLRANLVMIDAENISFSSNTISSYLTSAWVIGLVKVYNSFNL